MRILFALLVIVFVAFEAQAGDSKYPNGIQMEFSGGAGSATIGNPDNTNAYYSLLTLEGRGHLPLLGGDPDSKFAFDLTGNVRYIDLRNSAEAGTQKEVANIIGPGAGVHMRLFKFVVGYQYNFMLARHYAVGPISREMQYSMGMTSYYGGLVFPLQNLAISALYSNSSATLPKENTGLSTASPYTDQAIWLCFTYSTGASFSNFLKYLF